jgi:hypothetical protein
VLASGFYIVRFDSRVATGNKTRLLNKRTTKSRAIASNPTPR